MASQFLDRKGAPSTEVISFRGHRMVKATHPTTIEITREEHLTERGDCIIGVGSDRGCSDFSSGMKDAIRTDGMPLRFVFNIGGIAYEVHAVGDHRLELTNPHDLVIRKSDWVSDRTVGVRADSAARDIPRPLVRRLMDPQTKGTLTILTGAES